MVESNSGFAGLWKDVMSALCGWVSLTGRPASPTALVRMRNTLSGYGPHREGLLASGACAMAHNLLAICPEDRMERQPLESRDGRYRLVADARIFNRTELFRELGLEAGPSLPPTPDSALLLAAWRRWDADCLQHIEGDYAFALWDAEERTLHLARDPMGHRPLFWHRGEDRIAFASLPKALFALPGVPRELNRGRLAELLALVPHRSDETLYRGIQRVLPGHRMTCDDTGIAQRPARCLDLEKRVRLGSDDEYVEAFSEYLDRAVRERLRAEGGMASHLSAGYDSAAVTATAARLLAAEGRRLTAYTAVPRPGFDGPVPSNRVADEGPAAAALAGRFPNVDHVRLAPDRSAVDGLEEFCAHMDRPVPNPCNYRWLLQIEREAVRRGARVLLTGQAGNMTISYDGIPLLPALLKRGRWLRWLAECRALRSRHRRWRGLLGASFGPFVPPELWTRLQARIRNQRQDIFRWTALNPAFAGSADLAGRASRARWDLSYRPWADGRAMRAAVLQRTDPGERLMAAGQLGLELRDPTSDFRLAQFCLSIPEDQYLRGGKVRWILKRAMKDVFPPEIFFQQGGKGYQAADWFETLSPARDQISRWIERLESIPAAREVLDLPRMQAAVKDWPEDGWGEDEVIQTYRFMLLRGLSAGAFIRHVEGGNR